MCVVINNPKCKSPSPNRVSLVLILTELLLGLENLYYERWDSRNKSIKLYRCFSVTYMLFRYSVQCLQTAAYLQTNIGDYI